MKSSIFKLSDSISVLALPDNFETAYNRNVIHEGAAMCLFLWFMEEPTSATLPYRVSATDNNTTHRQGTLIIYCQAVNYLLEAYAAVHVIAVAEDDILN